MPNYGAYEVYVESDGKRLEEYDQDEIFEMNGVPIYICYIACEADKEFKIGVTIPKKDHKRENHAIEASIDGRKIGLTGSLIEKHPSPKDRTYYFERENLWNGNTRNFKFGSLKYTDDESLLGKEDIELGTIKVKIKLFAELHCQKVKKPKVTKKVEEAIERASPIEDRIHESSKKGLTHCVVFGEEEPYESMKKKKGSSVGTIYNAIDKDDFCEFHFLYRSMDTLIANGLVPQPEALQPSATCEANPLNAATAVEQSVPSPNAGSGSLLPSVGQPSGKAGGAAPAPTVSPAPHTTLAFTNPETRNEDIVRVKQELEENACLSLRKSTTNSRDASRAPEGEGSPPIDEDGGLDYLTPEPAPESGLLQDAVLETGPDQGVGMEEGISGVESAKAKGNAPFVADTAGETSGVFESLPPAQPIDRPATSSQPTGSSSAPGNPGVVSNQPPKVVEVIEISSDEDDEAELQHWDNQAKMCERELALMRELRIAKSNAHKIRSREKGKKRKREGEAGQAPKKVCVAEGVFKKEEKESDEARLDKGIKKDESSEPSRGRNELGESTAAVSPPEKWST